MDLNAIITRVFNGDVNGLRDAIYEGWMEHDEVPYHDVADFIDQHGTEEEKKAYAAETA